MEFGEGQVFGLNKITHLIKNTQTKKESELQRAGELALFNAAKDEIKALKSALDELCDEESIESSIYRLKAAELDFNRQLKSKKASSAKT